MRTDFDARAALAFVEALDELLNNPKIAKVTFTRQILEEMQMWSVRAVPRGQDVRDLVTVQGDLCRQHTRCEATSTCATPRRLEVVAHTNENHPTSYVPYGVRCEAMSTGLKVLAWARLWGPEESKTCPQ